MWFWEKRTKPAARRYEQTSYEKLDFRNIDNHINFAGVITLGYQQLLSKMFNLFNIIDLINPLKIFLPATYNAQDMVPKAMLDQVANQEYC